MYNICLGEYVWVNGDDFNASQYMNWSPSYFGPVESNDCVCLSALNNLQWSNENCDEVLPYICMRGKFFL